MHDPTVIKIATCQNDILLHMPSIEIAHYVIVSGCGLPIALTITPLPFFHTQSILTTICQNFGRHPSIYPAHSSNVTNPPPPSTLGYPLFIVIVSQSKAINWISFNLMQFSWTICINLLGKTWEISHGSPCLVNPIIFSTVAQVFELSSMWIQFGWVNSITLIKIDY